MQVASFVDGKLKEIASATPNKSFDQICVLTCLNLAAEIFEIREKNARTKQKLKQLLDKLDKKSS